MKIIDEIVLLETFLTLVQEQSLQNAAVRLLTTKSTVSRRIEQLESKIGIKLFGETAPKYALSEEGKDFVTQAEILVKEYRRIAVPWDLQAKSRQFIHISCPYSLGITLLIPWVTRYRQIHPEALIDVGLTLGPVFRLPALCDLRFSDTKVSDERLFSERLGLMPRVMLASPEYLARCGTPRTPKDLTAHSLLGSRDLVTHFSFLLRRVGEHSKFVKIPFYPSIRLRDYTSAKKAALVGAGIAVHALMHDTVQEVQKGELVRVLPEWEPEASAVSLLWPVSHPMSDSVKAFRDYIFEQWQAHPILLGPNAEDFSSHAG